jgi:hypothetical protein
MFPNPSEAKGELRPQNVQLDFCRTHFEPKFRGHRGTIHTHISLEFMAGTTGLEPATSAVTGQRSNQLSYVPTGCVGGSRETEWTG